MKTQETTKHVSIFLLRTAVYIIGLVILATCIFALPAGIASDNTGLYRPILIGMYLPAIPFFYALRQALRLLKYIDKNRAFSLASVRALSAIKWSALTIASLYAAGMPFIYYAADRDDAPGVVAVGLFFVFGAFIVSVFAGVAQGLLQNVIDIKSEHDLTV